MSVPALRVRCPACRLDQNVTPDNEGKAHCQACGQRMKLPPPPQNKTMLAGWAPPADEIPQGLPVAYPAPKPIHSDDVAPVEDEIPRPRARPRRDDEDDDRPRRRKRMPRESDFECPYCGCEILPIRVEKISVAGWVVFAVLIVSPCFPLFFLGLFMKENYEECVECHHRLR